MRRRQQDPRRDASRHARCYIRTEHRLSLEDAHAAALRWARIFDRPARRRAARQDDAGPEPSRS